MRPKRPGFSGPPNSRSSVSFCFSTTRCSRLIDWMTEIWLSTLPVSRLSSGRIDSAPKIFSLRGSSSTCAVAV